MPIEKAIPTIYASISNREDVNVNPTRADSVGSVLQSTQAVAYRNSLVSFSKEANEYVTSLELALLEALSDQFLADRIRELAEDRNLVSSVLYGGLKMIADKLAPQKSL
jgi:hypothetical protein